MTYSLNFVIKNYSILSKLMKLCTNIFTLVVGPKKDYFFSLSLMSMIDMKKITYNKQHIKGLTSRFTTNRLLMKEFPPKHIQKMNELCDWPSRPQPSPSIHQPPFSPSSSLSTELVCHQRTLFFSSTVLI